MPKYTALTPIKHDGKNVGTGEPISLSTKEAESLLDIGAISEGKPALTAAEQAAADKAAAEKAAAEKAAADKADAEKAAADQAGKKN